MEFFWKAMAVALVSTIVTVVLERQSRDFSLLVTLAASAMVLCGAVRLLEPVIELLGKLEALGGLSGDLLLSLIKIFGIGMAGELACSVCADAGNSAAAKGLRFAANAAILYLSCPVFSALTDLFLELLGEL